MNEKYPNRANENENENIIIDLFIFIYIIKLNELDYYNISYIGPRSDIICYNYYYYYRSLLLD